jgi:hypothetical protein
MARGLSKTGCVKTMALNLVTPESKKSKSSTFSIELENRSNADDGSVISDLS